MKIINLNELKLDSNIIGYGAFGKIYKCIYNNEIYAFKKFKYNDFLNNEIEKLDNLSKLNDEFLITPKFWVEENNKTNGYLTKLLNGKDIAALEGYDNKYKIEILNTIKHEINKMHSYGIIHCDISSSNIIIENNIPYLIDFDNSSYNNSPIKLLDASDIAQEFIKKYGVIKELDIFLFNLLTFELINECNYNLIRKNIILNNYGLFDNHVSKEICESFFLDDKIPEKRFLIDMIR